MAIHRFRAQASTEFIILLSAVALFALFVVSQYSHLQKTQHMLYGELANYSASPTATNAPYTPHGNGLYVGLIVQNTTYINKTNTVQVVLSYPGRYMVNSIRLQSYPNSTILPPNYSGLNYSYVDILSFSVVPRSAGSLRLSLFANITEGSVTEWKNLSAYSYSEYQNQNSTNGGVGYTAYIGKRNESLTYPVSQWTSLDSISIGEHCAYWSGNGQVSNEVTQCGSNTWGNMQYDYYCWPTEVMYDCFGKSQTGYATGTIGSKQSYRYNMTLDISNSTSLLHSNLSDTVATGSILNEMGSSLGNSSINNVTGQAGMPTPYRDYVVLGTGSGPYAVNITPYQNYTRAMKIALSILEQYNGTGICSASPCTNPDWARLGSNISIADISVKELLNSTPIYTEGCGNIYVNGSGSFFTCKPEVPFYYNITAYINGQKNLNETLLAQGSVIGIR